MIKPRNDFIKPVEVTIPITGIKKEYTFMHISDAHICSWDENSTEEEKALAVRNSNFWKEESGVYAIPALEMQLEYADDISADAVILTGDAVDYYSESNIISLTKCFKASDKKLIYARGNHEQGRENYPSFENIAGKTQDFTAHDFGEFYIISIDVGDLNITNAQIEKVKNYIFGEKPVVIAQHIPYRTDENEDVILNRWNSTSFLLGTDDDTDNTKELCRLVCEEKNSVAAVLSGHIHFSHSGEFASGKMQYIAAPAFFGFCYVVHIVPDEK